MVLESVKKYCEDYTLIDSMYVAPAKRICASKRCKTHTHKIRTFPSGTDGTLYRHHASDDVALITAMRGNIEHPSEDGLFVRQKHVFIRRLITRPLHFSFRSHDNDKTKQTNRKY